MRENFNIVGFTPKPKDFLSRCRTQEEARDILNYFLKRGEISMEERRELMGGFRNNGNGKRYLNGHQNPYSYKSISIDDVVDKKFLEKIKEFENNLQQSSENDIIFEEINDYLYEELGFSHKIQKSGAKHFIGYDITEYDGLWGRIKAIEAAELKNDEIVLDGGCYKGFLSLILGLLSKKLNKELNIMGVDLFLDHIESCQKNAELFDLDNIKFYQADLVDIELSGGVDVEIFYRSLIQHDIIQPIQHEYLDFYGTDYKRILDNTLKYLNEDGRIVVYDTERELINLCHDYLKDKSFFCESQRLYDGFLLKTRSE